jgi:hypothetical protein
LRFDALLFIRGKDAFLCLYESGWAQIINILFFTGNVRQKTGTI